MEQHQDLRPKQVVRPNGPADPIWDQHRATITQMWWTEDKQLPYVIETMSKEYGFCATPKQYKTKFGHWRIEKKIKTSESDAMMRIQAQREKTGKCTAFKLRDRDVDDAKILRTSKRHKASEMSDHLPGSTPTDITYYTPKEEDSVRENYGESKELTALEIVPDSQEPFRTRCESQGLDNMHVDYDLTKQVGETYHGNMTLERVSDRQSRSTHSTSSIPMDISNEVVISSHKDLPRTTTFSSSLQSTLKPTLSRDSTKMIDPHVSDIKEQERCPRQRHPIHLVDVELVSTNDCDAPTPIGTGSGATQLTLRSRTGEVLERGEEGLDRLDENLRLAAKSGDVEVVRSMLELGANINGRGQPDNMTALHHAAFMGNTEVILELTSRNAALDQVYGPVTFRTTSGDLTVNNPLPIHLAILNSHLEAAQVLLLHQRYSPKDCDVFDLMEWALGNGDRNLVQLLLGSGAYNKRYTPRLLVWIAEDEDMELVKVLLQANSRDRSDELLHVAKDGWLLKATNQNNIDFVRLLLQSGADPDGLIDELNPILLVTKAALNMSEDMVRTYVNHGASINHDEYSLDPLASVIVMTQGEADLVRREVCALLLRYGADPCLKAGIGSWLHYATINNEIWLIDVLLEYGVSVDCNDGNKNTPLHLAADAGNLFLVAHLLGLGAAVNIGDRICNSPLHRAMQNGFEDTAAELLKHGADIYFKNESGQTPLDNAVSRDLVGIVRLLLQRTVRSDDGTPASHVNKLNRDGWAPLHTGVSIGTKRVVKTMIELGARLNIPRSDGWTALHMAAQMGVYDMTRLLLKAGADSNVRLPVSGRTPLHLAVEAGNDTIASLLAGNRSCVNSTDTLGWTPLHLATVANNTSLMSFLVQCGAVFDAREPVGWDAKASSAWKDHRQDLEAFRTQSIGTMTFGRDFRLRPLHIAALHGDITTVMMIVPSSRELWLGDCAIALLTCATLSRETTAIQKLVDIYRNQQLNHYLCRSTIYAAIFGYRKEGFHGTSIAIEHSLLVDSIIHGLPKPDDDDTSQILGILFKGRILQDLEIDEKERVILLVELARTERCRSLEQLILVGFDVNSCDEEGQTLLHHMARLDLTSSNELSKSILPILVRNGLKAEARDKYGHAAICYAVAYSNDHFLECLFQNLNVQSRGSNIITTISIITGDEGNPSAKAIVRMLGETGHEPDTCETCIRAERRISSNRPHVPNDSDTINPLELTSFSR